MTTTIIIPAAGAGRRMRSYGPKALVEVANNQTLLGRQISILRGRFPLADIVVVVGFEAERVIRALPAGVRVVENELFEETNVARSVLLGLRAATCREALVVYGDLVFSRETFAAFPAGGGRSCLWVDTRGQMGEYEVGVSVGPAGEVLHLCYGLDARWAHIAFLAGREMALFKRLAALPGRRKCFGFEVLNDVLDHGGTLLAVEPPGMRVVEVDTSRDIAAARAVP